MSFSSTVLVETILLHSASRLGSRVTAEARFLLHQLGAQLDDGERQAERAHAFDERREEADHADAVAGLRRREPSELAARSGS